MRKRRLMYMDQHAMDVARLEQLENLTEVHHQRKWDGCRITTVAHEVM